MAKKVEEVRKELVKPLNSQVKETNNKYKHWLSVLKLGQDVIDTKLAQYKLEEKRRAIEAKEEAAKSQLGDFVVVDEKETTRGNLGSASTRQVWKAEITDEEQVPRTYCKPHLPMINAAVKAGAREIPGVRIYQKEELVVR